MSPDQMKALAERWTQPISAEAPAGKSARYDTDYEDLLLEMRKLESINRAEPNWALVETQASRLTEQKTKDLVVLGLLCIALFKNKGWQGLAAGLQAYRGITVRYWDALFPPAERVRGRASALSWLTQQLEASLPARQAEHGDHGAIRLCFDCITAIDANLRPHLNELFPRVGEITRTLSGLLEATAPLASKAPTITDSAASENARSEAAAASSGLDEETPQQAGGAQQPAAVASAPLSIPDTVESDEDAERALSQAVALIKRTASYYLRQSPARPLGYHLAHAGSFLRTTADGTLGQTHFPPNAIAEMRQSLEAGDLSRVITALAEHLFDGDATLSVFQIVAEALSDLGPDYRASHLTVVGDSLSSYWRMNREIDCSEEALDWLNTSLCEAATPLIAADSAKAPTSRPEPAPAGPQESTAAAELNSLEDARKVLGREGLQAACRMLQNAIETVAEPSRRFGMRLTIARLCRETQRPELAEPLLSDLERMLEEPIGSWRTDLLTEVLVEQLACLRELRQRRGDEEALISEQRRVLGRLATLNPALASSELGKRNE